VTGAANYVTTGRANLASTNTDIRYISTLMQSAGPISVGYLTGETWTDKCKLETTCNDTFTGTLTVVGCMTCQGNLSAAIIYMRSEVDSFVESVFLITKH
ncbi:MAG: hypothetical protein ACKPKO_49985, partial [Candidatus Fonsibacter sp.]